MQLIGHIRGGVELVLRENSDLNALGEGDFFLGRRQRYLQHLTKIVLHRVCSD